MKKVLVVDDTRNIRNLLTTCLELNEYTVVTANNGLQAIELILGESFDIAFIDVKMPGMSGTEVLRRIRSLGYSFPVIIMTAYATVRNAVECTKLDAVAYLQKPFTVDRVNDVLNALQKSTIEEDSFDDLIIKSKDLMDKDNQLEALKTLSKALSLNPSCGEIYFLMGVVYEKDNKTDEAKKYFGAAKVFGYK